MPASLDLIDEVVSAHQRIEPFVRKTYLQHSEFYSQLTGANVYFKCENLQLTGSFKLRGAFSKYTSLNSDQQDQGVVAASTGNHGKAVAYAARQFGGSCRIFAPENAEPGKLESIRKLGAMVQQAGSDCIEAEHAAREYARENSSVYISPYNDPLVVAGQGTIGVELCGQLDRIDAVFASMGGGGLISGIASYVQSKMPECQFVGCSPENSCVMVQSLAAGELLDAPSTHTISDGTAGGVEQGSITFDLCQRLVNQTVCVSEIEIVECLSQFIDAHGMLIEGAAAVAIAGLTKLRQKFTGQNIVVILCGANIAANRIAEILGSTGDDEENN